MNTWEYQVTSASKQHTTDYSVTRIIIAFIIKDVINNA